MEEIKKYFTLGYTHKTIIGLVEKNFNIQISLRTFERLMKEMNLKRKYLTESPIEEIVAAISLEIDDNGCNLGYRSLWLRLKKVYHLTIKQKTVLSLLKIIDPEGVEVRSRYKLKRRIYNALVPNFVWHADNYDKLKRFGFAIYGCIDRYSRKVIWVEMSTTNNDPSVIGFYFLKAVEKCGFLPTLIRADNGTEANLMEDMQMVLRYAHEDRYCGTNSFIRGKSTRNQRIESYWRQFRQRLAEFYINIFKSMEHENVLNASNPIHIDCLRYCFGDLIKQNIILVTQEWNKHSVRKQNTRNVPGGIPNLMFDYPEKFGTTDFKKEVDWEHVQRLKNYTKEPVIVSPKFREFANLLLNFPAKPTCAKDAYDLYLKLVDLINGLEMSIESNAD